MILRPYQLDAVRACYCFLMERDDHPCIVIPTAGGKTPVIATICRDVVQRWGGRVLVLAHVKELLEQAEDKLRAMDPTLPVGICSAGLGSKDFDYPITLAGIQSVYKHAKRLGHIDLVMIDEAHLIPPDGDGMYRTLLQDLQKINPIIRRIGLTATPYRMATGTICGPHQLLNAVCYEIGVRALMDQGYLCGLVSRAGTHKVDMAGVTVRGGEYLAQESERRMNAGDVVEAAVHEIITNTRDRTSCLIFCAGVDHARHVAREFENQGEACAVITGDTLDLERATILEAFKAREIKYLANVNVLTTGFDATCIDCIAMLRPTLSPGLYYQMVGRGFRLDPGKTNCLVLDFAGNIMRHGPVDRLRADGERRKQAEATLQECPQCHLLLAMDTPVCPDCGYIWPPPAPAAGAPRPRSDRHDRTHDREHGILSGNEPEVAPIPRVYQVEWVGYDRHENRRDPSKPPTLKVSYRVGIGDWVHEWICIEHTGFANQKARGWWAKHSRAPFPRSVDEALDLIDAGAVARPTEITVVWPAKSDFPRITKHTITAVPEWYPNAMMSGMEQEEEPASIRSREQTEVYAFGGDIETPW